MGANPLNVPALQVWRREFTQMTKKVTDLLNGFYSDEKVQIRSEIKDSRFSFRPWVQTV